MKLAKTLIQNASGLLKDRDLTYSLYFSSQKLINYCQKIQKYLRGDLKKEENEMLRGVNPLDFPDMVWTQILEEDPNLGQYPLGEITERAIKKTIIIIIQRASISENQITHKKLPDWQRKLWLIMNPDCEAKILEIFLTHYFFEICIDQIRRPEKEANIGWAYEYNFSKQGWAKSIKEEEVTREKLAIECDGISKKFLKYLHDSLKEEDWEKKARLIIRKGFIKEIDMRLPFQRNIVSKPLANVIIGNRLKTGDLVLGRTSIKTISKKFNVPRNAKKILFDQDNANVILPISDFETCLGKEIQPLIKDLFEIGTSIYIADLHTRRKDDLSRKIGIVLPVRATDKWELKKGKLEKTVSFLGRDQISFHFTKHQQRIKEEKLFAPTKVENQKSCICLFSGGLDSMAGAVWALENGLDPIFVSHFASYKLGSIQKQIIRKLYEIYDLDMLSMKITETSIDKYKSAGIPKAIVSKLHSIKNMEFRGKIEIEKVLKTIIGQDMHTYKSTILQYSRSLKHFGFKISKPKNTDNATRKIWNPLGASAQSPMAQFLRTFLFLSVATGIALEKGINKIYIFENGPVAINPLFSEARLNTRTSHPHFLTLFQDLIRSISGVDIIIDNPFMYLTKGEIVGLMARTPVSRLIADTTSCWNWFRIPLIAKQEELQWCRETHCGECVPCIIRKLALNKADLSQEDSKYLFDLFAEYPFLQNEQKVLFADFIRFFANILAREKLDLLYYAPDISNFSSRVTTPHLIDMFKTYATEIISGLMNMGNTNIIQDFYKLIIQIKPESIFEVA